LQLEIDSFLWRIEIMSAEDWLQAAKAEEQRLLREIMKSDLYLQLEAVRAVIAVYSGKPPAQVGSSQPMNAAPGLGPKMNLFSAA
jgi:hypothetical protein